MSARLRASLNLALAVFWTVAMVRDFKSDWVLLDVAFLVLSIHTVLYALKVPSWRS